MSFPLEPIMTSWQTSSASVPKTEGLFSCPPPHKMPGPRLPTELLDHIVDLLRDARDTLRICCLVSKSWIPRTRKHLFAFIIFHTTNDLRLWKNAFSDSSTSPACYTKSLVIKCFLVITTADAEEGGWISAFSRVENFKLDFKSAGWQATNDESISFLASFHGFSPVLTLLCIKFSAFPSSCISNLIQSFPLLEHLILFNEDRFYSSDGSGCQFDVLPPSSSPPFTGSLGLSLRPSMGPIVLRLLSPSYSLHFCKLHLAWFHGQDVALTTELVERCASTLEFIHIDCLIRESVQYLRSNR